jgi:hypothetical protein
VSQFEQRRVLLTHHGRVVYFGLTMGLISHALALKLADFPSVEFICKSRWISPSTSGATDEHKGSIIAASYVQGRPLAAPVSKGFLHFVSRFGNATPKLAQMMNYVFYYAFH